MSEKKRAAGLLVMTELPGMGLVAVLQRRGEFNHEKMGPESFPGAMQLTAWGGMKDDEEYPLTAALRECEEEIGKEATSFVVDRITFLVRHPDDPEKPRSLEYVQEIYYFEDEKKLGVAFAVKLPCEFLQEIRLGPSSGGIRLLKEEEIEKIQDLKNFDKVAGVTDRNVLAMFADAKETIQKAFALCRK